MSVNGHPQAVQQFPRHAATFMAECAGLCKRRNVEVVSARVGLTWRQAIEFHMCAECLAEFVTGAEAMGGHVYVQALDGLFHEVRA
jgi:hypothetical protein